MRKRSGAGSNPAIASGNRGGRGQRGLFESMRGGRCVAASRGLRDALAALLCVKTAVLLDFRGFVREVIVLDRVAEPSRIIARVALKVPSAIVPGGYLQKNHKVLSAEIDGAIRSAKIEAAVGAEFSFRVIASVAQS